MSEIVRPYTSPDSNRSVVGLVSVIIPVFNARKYLRECLTSVARQVYHHIEVLMVNDGSCDGSDVICREFEDTDRRFHLINRTNGGVSAARNTGIDQASGEFICFIDADDLLHPYAIAAWIGALNRSGAQIAFSAFDVNTTPRFSEISDPASLPMKVYDNITLLEKGLYQSIMVNSAWSALFHRSIFMNGLRFSEGKRYEDLDIFYKWIMASDKVAYLPEKLYFYRQHDESFIQRFAPARLDVLDVTDEMLSYIGSLGIPALEKAARDRRFSAHFNIWTLILANGIEMSDVEERCRKVIRAERVSELLNPHVRIKNKLGALASFGGRSLIRLLMRFVS